MKRLCLIALGCIVCSCAPSMAGQRIVTKKKMYLYRVSYNPEAYPYSLWNIEIVGGHDQMHEKIAAVPKGQILTVDRARFLGDFYGPGSIRIKGTMVYAKTTYKVVAECSADEYSTFFVEMP